jgi:signal-transduction protein with cAMP-binding, CBS, and nucleotidyltransferase domain
MQPSDSGRIPSAGIAREMADVETFSGRSPRFACMELARNLRVDSVSRLLPTPAQVVESWRTVADAVEHMRKENVGCLLICREGCLVGVFTERDLMCRVLGVAKPLTVAIFEVMTPNPVTVHSKDSIRTAIKKMQQGGYRHLPVIDEENRPVGVLSVKRLVRYLVEHYPGAVYNLPPDPGSVPNEREGA